MNRFDYDHPMYVHMIKEPSFRSVPTVSALRKSFPASADLYTPAAEEVIRTEPYPPPRWSITRDTLDTMRRNAPEFKLFIEVGTFIGNGVFALNDYFTAEGIRCPIVTVDTYAGTLLIGISQNTHKHGFIRYFDRNVLGTLFASKGMGDSTFPVNATARDFFRKYYYLGLQASHIYLDASHEYLDTYEEMRLAWECLEEGGVLSGDDYNWATVKAAVDRFCFEKRVPFTVTKGQTNDGDSALQWVIGAKHSAVRHDDRYHVNQAVA